MAEEFKRRTRSMQYMSGSTAPKIERPQRRPQPEVQPKTAPQPAPKPQPKKAPSHLFSSMVMIAGIFVLAAAAFFLLTRSLTISEKQMEINELKAEIEELYTTRDAKIANYNGSVDMVEIATRAAEYGMHKPTADQITFVD